MTSLSPARIAAQAGCAQGPARDKMFASSKSHNVLLQGSDRSEAQARPGMAPRACTDVPVIHINGQPARAADTNHVNHSFDDLVSQGSSPESYSRGKMISLEEARECDDIRLRGFDLGHGRSAISTMSTPTSTTMPLDSCSHSIVPAYNEQFTSKAGFTLCLLNHEVAYTGRRKMQHIADALKGRTEKFVRKHRESKFFKYDPSDDEKAGRIYPGT